MARPIPLEVPVTRTTRGEALDMINPEKPLRAEASSAAGKNTMSSVIFRFLRSGRDPQYFRSCPRGCLMLTAAGAVSYFERTKPNPHVSLAQNSTPPRLIDWRNNPNTSVRV